MLLGFVLATGTACAQKSQSPVNIVLKDVKVDENLPNFGPDNRGARELSLPYTFNVENNVGAPFCVDPPGPPCGGNYDKEWGTLKAIPIQRDGRQRKSLAPAPHIVFGGAGYTLKEFHFHTPSEHLIDKEDTAMELHAVFISDDRPACRANKILVLGKRIKLGDENEEFDKIFGPTIVLPENYHAPATTVPGFVLIKVLGDLSQSYQYEGSLTAPSNLGCTPPGTPDEQLAKDYLPEVVYWVVLKDAIGMSQPQIDRFRKLFIHEQHGHEEGNSRKAQDLNDRKVKMTPAKP